MAVNCHLARHGVTGQDGDVEFEFIAGRPALDFVATVAERATTDEEKLVTPRDLGDFVQQSDLVEGRLTVTDRDLRRAKDLREAMFGLIVALTDGARPRRDDRELVNAAAAGRRPVATLSPTGLVHRTGDLTAVLAELAHDCVDLFDGPDRDALRWCADARCTRPFVDHSRGQQRRWCGMKGCGDRAKAAAYRRRHRPPGPLDHR